MKIALMSYELKSAVDALIIQVKLQTLRDLKKFLYKDDTNKTAIEVIELYESILTPKVNGDGEEQLEF